jgi:hypothetical protein
MMVVKRNEWLDNLHNNKEMNFVDIDALAKTQQAA